MSLPAICLDAGHYGKYNRSTTVSSYYESEVMWKLHLLVKEELEAYGFPVRLTRESQEKDLDLVERGKKAKGCGLFLSFHSNATGTYTTNESVDYPLVYYPIDFKGDAIDGKGKDIATQLANCIKATMGTSQAPIVQYRKGTGNWDYLGVINGARRVGVVGLLLEHSFHTNTKMTNWLLDNNNLKKLAKAEAEVIAKYYGAVKPNNGPEEVLTKSTDWYRIRKTWSDAKSQIGAYKNLSLAKQDCLDGYNVYDPDGKAIYPVAEPVTPSPVKVNKVLEWQKAAIADGFNFPEHGADGDWGPECEKVAKEAVVKKQLIGYKYPNLTKIVQKAVGFTDVKDIDGLCGKETKKAIETYQSNHGLVVDGCVGLNTWKVILEV